MQHLDPSEASTQKTHFKKRLHRPWGNGFVALESAAPTAEELSSPLKALAALMPNPDSDPEIAVPGLSVQAEVDVLLEQAPVLAVKPQGAAQLPQAQTAEAAAPTPVPTYLQAPSIQAEKALKPEPAHLKMPLIPSENSVIIGGFFHPKGVGAAQSQATDGPIGHLMNELKNKEREILLLDHDLQLNKALEEARKAEIARAHESQARKTAEENALFAIQKAHAAVEKTQKAENEVLTEKRLRLDLERTKQGLEERIQAAMDELALKEQALVQQEEVKKNLEERCLILKNQMDSRLAALQKEQEHALQEVQEQISVHEKAKANAQTWAQKSMESMRQSELAKQDLEEKNAILLEQTQQLEAERVAAEEKQRLSTHLMTQALEQVKNLEAIIETEKNLRKILEEKMTDSNLRAEEMKRKKSEELVLAMEQKILDLEADHERMESKLIKTKRSIRNLEILNLTE